MYVTKFLLLDFLPQVPAGSPLCIQVQLEGSGFRDLYRIIVGVALLQLVHLNDLLDEHPDERRGQNRAVPWR